MHAKDQLSANKCIHLELPKAMVGHHAKDERKACVFIKFYIFMLTLEFIKDQKS